MIVKPVLRAEVGYLTFGRNARAAKENDPFCPVYKLLQLQNSALVHN